MQPIIAQDRPVHARKAPLSTRFDADAGRDVELGSCIARPTWRGGVHLIGLCLAIPSLALLIVSSDTARARIGTAVYAVGLCTMLAVSVTYHRWVHDLRARAVWRRADHAAIFAAIAGSTTPIVLIAMPWGTGYALIAVVWALSLAGAVLKIGHWEHGDLIGTVFYALVSLVTALSLPALLHRGGVLPAVFFVVSGALYIVGAVWFAKRLPHLRPAVFSYHEVWHVFTVLAAAAHFTAVWAIAT